MKNTARLIVWATPLLWLLPGVAQADAVPIGPIMCAYPDGYRPCSDGPRTFTPPPPPYDPLPDLNRRYLTALSKLSERVSGLQSLVNDAQPATMEELRSRLDIAFVGGAYRLDSLNATRRRLAGDVSVSQERLETLRREAVQMEEGIASATGRKINFQKQRDAALVRAREAQAGIAAMKVRTDAFDKRSGALATSIVQWLAAAAPPKARIVSAAAAQRRGHISRSEMLPDLSTDAYPARLNPTRPPLPPGPERRVEFRNPPAGSVTEKLAAIETLPPLLDEAVQAVERLNPALAGIQMSVDAAAVQNTALRQTSDAIEQEVWAMQWAADNANTRAIYATSNERIAASNMLRAATEAYILQTLRDEVAIPAARNLLASNRASAVIASLTNRKVAALYAAGRSAITTPVGGVWANLDAFMETERVILDGLKDPMNYIKAAADELGSSGRSRADELGAAICAGQTRHVLDITEKAAGALPGPLGAISRDMVDGACH